MAFIRNTNPVLWSPTGVWSAVPTHGEILNGSSLIIRRPMAFVDDTGVAVTDKPDATKSVILPAGAAAAGINIECPNGHFTAAEWKKILEAFWSGKSLNLRLLSASDGTAITGGGYADQAVAAWTVVE